MNIQFGTYKVSSQDPEEIIESEIKLSSSYIHDHLLNIALENSSNFNSDNTGIVYQIYNALVTNNITNPQIIVTKSIHSQIRLLE